MKGVKGLTACALGAVLACATPPKPRELEAFDTLRKANEATLPEAAKRSPDLASEADRRSAAAHDEWQSNDLDESRRDALIATIRLKSALAIYEQDQLKARIQTLSGQQAQAEEESAGLNKDLASEQEKVALLQKYVDARQTAAADKQQMSSEQQKAQAEQQRLSQQLVSEQKIAAAQLALRTADTVEASKYATAEYSAAGDLLAKADAELKQSDYTAAQASAEVAKKNADRAAELAKPQYEQAAQSNEDKARNDALARDAPTIAGVTVRIDPQGDLQRLVVVIPALFNKREPNIAPGHDGILDGVAALLKKYPSYPVQVIGYTDNRGKSTELIAVSAARAQAVYSALAARGVEVKRLMVSGLGGENPFVDNRSAAGRAKNNRAEIVFMYH
ncbi:MAG TPA: OmpA family protein [Polyangia bacterium]|nr:OmpA family protein [Polyangia bacterium]